MESYKIKKYSELAGYEVLDELQTVVEKLTELHIEIAFIRSQETLDKNHPGKVQRIQLEGERDALTEVKWLILKVLEEKKGLVRINGLSLESR